MASNRNSGHRPGGGIASNKVVQKPVMTGKSARQYHQGGVSQFGESVGNHITNKGTSNYKGDPVRGSFRPPGTPGSVPLGNQIAGNVGAGGPGKGRTLYGQSGMQGTHGSPAPGNAPSKTRDTLAEYGPDYKAPRS
jgi:hypothetical protein